ncbi:YciI family protein [Actinomycetes bacterium KLBMP 9797]
MKYLLLMCVDESVTFTDEEDRATMAATDAWVQEMTDRKVRLQGDRLRPVSDATTVRTRDGEVLVADGPFAETKEQIGGFDIIDCADLDEALEVAAKHPVAGFGTVEVRPFWQW